MKTIKIIFFHFSALALLASCSIEDDTTTQINFNEESFALIAYEKGDLDGDGIEELVQIRNTDNYTDLGIEREILIYKNNNEQWALWSTSKGAVLPSKHSSVGDEPFNELSIENQEIIISHSSIGKEPWEQIHKYKLVDTEWKLVDAFYLISRKNEIQESLKYSLLNGIVNYEKNLVSTSQNHSIMKLRFENKPDILPNMNGFYPGSNRIELLNPDRIFYY